jgi:hypothetical protein
VKAGFLLPFDGEQMVNRDVEYVRSHKLLPEK